jgi:hypothetical protein
MKRIFTTTLLFVSVTSLLLAQTANEIIKFSQQGNYGTSRGIAMGGAVGALSSEYASVNVNPAALGTFRMGQVMLTPGVDMYKTNSNGEPDSRNSFVINGASIAYSFDNSSGVFNRFNLSFGYNLHSNFNAYYSIKDEELRITTIGHTGEYSLAFGTSYLDKLYLGISTGLSDLRYERQNVYNEPLNNSEYETASYIDGRGFIARLGLLYIPIEKFTVGVAVQSPVFYSLSTRTSGRINSSIDLESDTYDFSLRTPWRLSFNASYALNTLAVFSFDYEVVTNNLITLDGDYLNMTPSATDNLHAINNYLLSDATKVSMNFRVGGEVRLNDFFVRGGFGYFGAPTDSFKGVITGSGGLGYRIGFAAVDVAYRYATFSEEYYYPYPSISSTSPLITTDYIRHQFRLTVSYRF